MANLPKNHIPRLAFVFLASLSSLSAHSFERVCAPELLLKVVTTIETPDLPANHFYRVPKTLYRLGETKGRIEEGFNPDTGIHQLFVVNEPDFWMVNLADLRGRYIRDPGPTFYFRAHIFGHAAAKSVFIRELEIGCEMEWFRDVGVKSSKVMHPDLGIVNRLEFLDGNEKLVLYERSNRPLRIELSSEGQFIMAMNYLSYEVGFQSHPELFIKPEGIAFENEGGT
jgi:hypothetical protein